MQTVLSILRRDLAALGEEEIPGLIEDSTTLQVTWILRGNYDLKIARQDYFMSNQEQVGCFRFLLYTNTFPVCVIWVIADWFKRLVHFTQSAFVSFAAEIFREHFHIYNNMVLIHHFQIPPRICKLDM